VPFLLLMHSATWVYGCSFAGITGSNPAGTIDVVPLWVLCVVRLITSPEESYHVWCVHDFKTPTRGLVPLGLPPWGGGEYLFCVS